MRLSRLLASCLAAGFLSSSLALPLLVKVTPHYIFSRISGNHPWTATPRLTGTCYATTYCGINRNPSLQGLNPTHSRSLTDFGIVEITNPVRNVDPAYMKRILNMNNVTEPPVFIDLPRERSQFLTPAAVR